MKSVWEQDLEKGLLLATILMCVDLAIGFVSTILFQVLLTAVTVGTWGFIELGVLLIVGGCLMSRQPLENSARYDKDGEPTTAWKMARIGRQLLFAAVFIFIYVGVITILSYIVLF